MATFEVTNKADSGEGSLRAAVDAANAAPGSDEIVFSGDALVTEQSPAAIVLTSGRLEITDSLTLRGPGRDTVVIDGGEASSIFHAATAGDDALDLVIEGVTLQRGSSGEDHGGCISAEKFNTTIRASTIQNCSTENSGGALFAIGDLTVEDSLITGNSSKNGGGLIVAGDLVVSRSVISNNTTDDNGGGIFHYGVVGANVTIEESTIAGNTAQVGGGIAQFAPEEGVLALRHSTLSGNSSTGDGSAIVVAYGGDLLIENSTISGNTAGGIGAVYVYEANATTVRNSTIVGNQAESYYPGVSVYSGSVLVESSILSGNTSSTQESEDLSLYDGPLIARSSLIQAPGYGVDAEALSVEGNLVGVDPQLAPLSDNGGPTKTHLPLDGSPVIDAGSNSAELESDQRGDGFAREIGAGVDIGAVEVAPAGVTLSLDGSPVDEGGSATVTATLSRTSNLDVTIELGFSGTATKGDDYTPSAETITIAAGQTTGSITLAVVDDDEEEGEETIVVAISGVTNAVEVNPSEVTATITASDQPAPSPSPSPSPAPGGGSGGGDGCGCSSGGDAVTALALGAVMFWGVVSRRFARG